MPKDLLSSRHLGLVDAVLALLAVGGVVLYLWVLPTFSPDARARMPLDQEEIIDNARQFLSERGFEMEDLEPHAEFRRDPDLITALQERQGRTQGLETLGGSESALLPAYYWNVRFNEDGEGAVYTLALTPEGAVWRFENERTITERQRFSTEIARDRIDRGALRAAFAAERAEGIMVPDSLLLVLGDSALVEHLAFGFNPAGVPGIPPSSVNVLDVFFADSARQFFLLGESAAEAIAAYHLSQTSLPAASFTADSAWVLAERVGRTARVRFGTPDSLAGQYVEAEVEISAIGALHQLRVQFNPSDESGDGLDPSSMLGISGLVLCILGGFILLPFFARRLLQRRIDIKATLIDASIIAGSISLSMFMSLVNVNIDGTPEYVELLIGLALGFSVSLLIFGAGAFALAGVTNSLAHEAWPKKMLASSLFRQGSVQNRIVGASLVRGALLAWVIIGLELVVIWGFPNAYLETASELTFDHILAPLVSTIGFTAGVSMSVWLMIIGLASLLFRWGQSGALAVIAVLLIGGLGYTPFGVTDPWLQHGLAAGLGLLVAAIFWYFDLLTLFIAGWIALLYARFSEVWLIEGIGSVLDTAVLGGLTASIFIVGLVGVYRPRRGQEIDDYVPPYLQELAQQERMQRELEIAHQVQEFFLPRRMPDVEGVDLAAMCLAAQEVGGDYYDVIDLGQGRLGIVIGDVSGKGIQAAFFMTLTKGFIQTLCHDCLSPAEVLRRVNKLFSDNAPRGTFISMIYGILDVNHQTFTFARAGHNPVILGRGRGTGVEVLQPPGLAIGLATGARFDDTIEEVVVDLRNGDVIVLYTDGFSEAINRHRELYGDDRLVRKVSEVQERAAGEVLRMVTEDVHRFVEAAGRQDDMTMVVFKLAPSIAARRLQSNQTIKVNAPPVA